MYRDATVGVVVPAYNEEAAIGRVIDSLPTYVDRAYVVDDGSTDGTWSEITEHAAAVNDERGDTDGPFEAVVVPIQHASNRGVGGAIKTGYQRAREERIEVTAVMGGDDQMDPSHLERYLDPIIDGEADYTKGNRFLARDDLDAMPRFRLVGNVVLTWLTKLASGYWGIGDPQNGYTAISLAALETADIDGMYEYYGYCNDILVKLNVERLRVADVARPSTYTYREGWDSHIVYSEYIPRVSWMLLRNYLWRQVATFERDRTAAAPVTLLGLATLVVGAITLVGSLLSGGPGGGTLATAILLVGGLVWGAGVSLDRRASRAIERQVVDEAARSGPVPRGDAIESATD